MLPSVWSSLLSVNRHELGTLVSLVMVIFFSPSNNKNDSNAGGAFIFTVASWWWAEPAEIRLSANGRFRLRAAVWRPSMDWSATSENGKTTPYLLINKYGRVQHDGAYKDNKENTSWKRTSKGCNTSQLNMNEWMHNQTANDRINFFVHTPSMFLLLWGFLCDLVCLISCSIRKVSKDDLFGM